MFSPCKNIKRNFKHYVSVNSKLDHPPGQTPEEFFERADSQPLGQKESAKPRPLLQKYRAKTPPKGATIFKNLAKKHKT